MKKESVLSPEVINSVYRLILLRAASDEEVGSWLKQGVSLENFLSSVLNAREFKFNKAKFNSKYFPMGDSFSEFYSRNSPDNHIIISEVFGSRNRPRLPEADVARAFEKVRENQGSYQPHYGEPVKSDDRLDVLLKDVGRISAILDQFNAADQVRVVDVGSNLGFVSMKLAEKFANVVGVEGDRPCFIASSDLAARSKSRASFLNTDFLQLVGSSSSDISSVDAVLMLNVIHQFIFTRGLVYTQRLMQRLSYSVDYLFAEVAVQEDYIPFGRQHLLPSDPAEIFALCDRSHIEVIRDGVRPFFILRRVDVPVGGVTLKSPQISFTRNTRSNVSRKYYTTSEWFAKQYRRTVDQGLSFFENEVSALLRLSGTGTAPEIVSFDIKPSVATLVTERVYGVPLIDMLRSPMEASFRRNIIRRLTRLVLKQIENNIYQNDVSLHNIFLKRDGQMVLVDYELASSRQFNDMGAMLAWCINDIWRNKPESYEIDVSPKLSLSAGIEKSDLSLYPDPLDFPKGFVRQCLKALRDGGDLTATLSHLDGTMGPDE